MTNENKAEKINELNNIFGELINDSKSFAKDMMSGIYLYYFAGILSIIFGIQTGWYNQTYILNYDLIPLILVMAQILVGLILMTRGYVLKKKYSRIFTLDRRI